MHYRYGQLKDILDVWLFEGFGFLCWSKKKCSEVCQESLETLGSVRSMFGETWSRADTVVYQTNLTQLGIVQDFLIRGTDDLE